LIISKICANVRQELQKETDSHSQRRDCPPHIKAVCYFLNDPSTVSATRHNPPIVEPAVYRM